MTYQWIAVVTCLECLFRSGKMLTAISYNALYVKGRLIASQLVQAIPQRPEADAQQFGRLVFVPVGDLQGL